MPRRRIVFLKAFAADVRRTVGRPRKPMPAVHKADRRTAEELERRLDETRARLRREIPPPDDSR